MKKELHTLNDTKIGCCDENARQAIQSSRLEDIEYGNIAPGNDNQNLQSNPSIQYKHLIISIDVFHLF